jgi:hypothetical protein
MSARRTGIRADHTVPGGDDLGPSAPLPSGEPVAVGGWLQRIVGKGVLQ